MVPQNIDLTPDEEELLDQIADDLEDEGGDESADEQPAPPTGEQSKP